MRALVFGVAVTATALSWAEARMMIRDFGPPRVDFRMEERPVAPATARAHAQPAFLSGSTVATVAGGALVLDADSGYLIRTDEAGARTARLMIGADAAQMVFDPITQRAIVTDRARDRVVIVSVTGDRLATTKTIATHTEPYGLALSPDHATLLVTTVADPRLTAYDVVTGAATWSIELTHEPRGVAIDPAGDEALVTFLNTSAVARFELGGDGAPTLAYDPLASAQRLDANGGIRQTAAMHDREVGLRHVRAAFAATYLGDGLAVVAHQTSGPKLAVDGNERRDTYGGGSADSMPVDHRITFLAPRERGTATAQATIGVHQPRAMAYDGASGTLYVAGYGSDEVLAIADASRAGVRMRWRRGVNVGVEGCGPTGLAVAGDGVRVFCSLTRQVVTMNGTGVVTSTGPALAGSRLSASAQRGRSLFRRGNDNRISGNGLLACSSCHPEGRADSLSWRIQGKALQTPVLAARLEGTHPFKWDGGDPTLTASLRSTVTRLGGRGITEEMAKDIQAYLHALPRPRAPAVTAANKKAVARGKALFNDRSVGCATCHSGKRMTDGKRHDVAMDFDQVDTPSLIGLAISAPYYHDGSAQTLRAVLREQGSIHSMGRTGQLDEKQIADLVAYLETL